MSIDLSSASASFWCSGPNFPMILRIVSRLSSAFSTVWSSLMLDRTLFSAPTLSAVHTRKLSAKLASILHFSLISISSPAFWIIPLTLLMSAFSPLNRSVRPSRSTSRTSSPLSPWILSLISLMSLNRSFLGSKNLSKNTHTVSYTSWICRTFSFWSPCSFDRSMLVSLNLFWKTFIFSFTT